LTNIGSFDVPLPYPSAERQPPVRHDLQANLLADLRTRIVAPLLMSDLFEKPITRVTPVFVIEDRSYFAAVHLMTAIPLSEIGDIVLDASARADELTRAIDFTFQGF
jgi:toxin CcdB